jgi:hypothetical protein
MGMRRRTSMLRAGTRRRPPVAAVAAVAALKADSEGDGGAMSGLKRLDAADGDSVAAPGPREMLLR